MATSRWGGWRAERLRRLVVLTYGRTCWLCHRPIVGTVSVDHVIPRSKGGGDDIANLRPAHGKCNSRRGAKDAPTPLDKVTDW